MMGGLRERSDDELGRASREELQSALSWEWEEREQVGVPLHAATLPCDATEMKRTHTQMLTNVVELNDANAELGKVNADQELIISSLHARLRDSDANQVRATSPLQSPDNRSHISYGHPQNRLEEAVATRDAVIDKLRVTIRDKEREKKELDRRYAEQVGLAQTFNGSPS
jgi:hypothetical protein